MPFRLFIGLSFYIFCAFSQAIELNPKHPESYTVAAGDTLWDLADRFLKHPWQWPEIWKDNPQIKNPHWIYPGDVITLSWADGKPSLRIERASEQRLSPSIRTSPASKPIQTIPIDAIRAFLTHPKLVDEGELEKAPRVIAFADEHLIAGTNDRIYVQAIDSENPRAFMIFRKGETYESKGEILGHEAVYIADAELQQAGHPATLKISQSAQEIQIGDSLLPIEPEKLQMSYEPHAPSRPVRGQIIGVVDGVTQIGQYQVVVIDKGKRDGVEAGHVLQIFQNHQDRATDIALPEDNMGLVMAFQAFEKLSFALVMKTTSTVHVLDGIKNP